MKDNRLLEMQVFRAVVEHDGFTAAAHALESSQPFISRVIDRLEKRLGAKLIHRTTRKQRLTTEGERYLATCREILTALDDAESNYVNQSVPTGDIRVSAPLAFGTDQILPLLPNFLATYDRMKVHLSLNDAIVNLIEDNVDVAVRMGRLGDSRLKARKLCDLRRIIVAAPSYIKRYGSPATPEALKDHNCLEWSGAQEHLNRWPFRVRGKRREHIAAGNFRSNNGLSLAAVCFQGVGVMRMAEHLALPSIREGRLVRLLRAFEEHDGTAIHAVYLPERRLSTRVRVFIEYLADAFRTPPWEK